MNIYSEKFHTVAQENGRRRKTSLCQPALHQAAQCVSRTRLVMGLLVIVAIAIFISLDHKATGGATSIL
jgi:hypothetical protein